MEETTYLKTQKAYQEILEVMRKHKDLINYDPRDFQSISEKHLYGLDLKEKYGLDINPRDIHHLDYQRFGDDRFIGRYGEVYRRTISWEDEGRQPEDEVLFMLGFSTGPYIFGDDYPTELFKEFFQELKSYKPKYIDSVNKCLYWDLGIAKDIFNEYPKILKKYHEKNKTDAKKRKIEKLKKELEEMQSTHPHL